MPQAFPGIIKFCASAGTSALVGKRVLNCLWELTYRCTARCEICNYWRNPSDPNRELQYAEIQEGLEKIYRYGCRIVNFTGGEPTLRDDLEDIVSYASHLGMWTSVVTNGSLLSRNRMRDLKHAGLDNLFVSLDSTHANLHDKQRGFEGSYAKVIDCMQWISEDFLTGHRTGGIMCVLTNSNVHEAERFITLADEIGVYVVFQPYNEIKTANPDFNVHISQDIIDEILRLKRKHKNVLCSDGYLRGFPTLEHPELRAGCSAGYKYFSIDPYGYLHPCVEMPSTGHLLTDDLSAIRSTEALGKVNSCRGCWYIFRGEADGMLSVSGCLEKLHLGFTVVMRNGRNKRRKIK